MNIIEAIKSGKDFRRESWLKGCYLYSGISMSTIKFRENNIKYILDGVDITADDWEVKEDNKSSDEVKMKFDPTKPVQTRRGEKSRILCNDFIGNKPIIAAINFIREDHDNISSIGESIYGYYEDGKFNEDIETDVDLINIPEPKPIDIHIGGVYRTKGGSIFICNKYNDREVFEYIKMCSGGLCNPSGDDIVELLGDIQDLNSYIKEKLK